jgi:hypothetical protein
MPKEVRVTPSQADAAKLIVERDIAKGRRSSPAIRKIADARASRDAKKDSGGSK